MNESWNFLKARKRKDYLTRKPTKTFVEHPESGFEGKIGKYAFQYVNDQIKQLGEAGKGITKEQREAFRKKILNDMLNMPQNFGLNVLHGVKASDFADKNKAAKTRGKTLVTHDDGFEGSVGKRAAHVIRQHNAQGINVIPDEKVEDTRKLLAQDMTENPAKYGLTVGKKPAATPAPALPTLASKPVLPEAKPTQAPQMAKIMRAIKILQTNNIPVSQESLQAILPHLPEAARSNPNANFYPQGLTPEGKFQPQRLATAWQGRDIETPEQMEQMRQHIRDNPDRRVQDEDFFERERIKDIESRGHTPEAILDMIASGTLQGGEPKQSMKTLLNQGTGFAQDGTPLDAAPPDPMAFAERIAGKRNPKTTGATEGESRPEIPAGAGKAKTANVHRDQGLFDTRSQMTEAELNAARKQKFEADMAARAAATTKREMALRTADKSITNPQNLDDWMKVLQFHQENPMAGDVPSLSRNQTKETVEGMLGEDDNLKEEYS
jgi:hypothetical protein